MHGARREAGLRWKKRPCPGLQPGVAGPESRLGAVQPNENRSSTAYPTDPLSTPYFLRYARTWLALWSLLSFK